VRPILGEAVWLGVHAAEDLADASGEEKKAAVLDAVGYVFDVVAPLCPLGFLSPFRAFLKAPIKQIVLLVAGGLVEVVVSKMQRG
jgi:hypothetical protein